MTDRDALPGSDQIVPRHADHAFDPDHDCELCPPPLVAMPSPTAHHSAATCAPDPPHAQAGEVADSDSA